MAAVTEALAGTPLAWRNEGVAAEGLNRQANWINRGTPSAQRRLGRILNNRSQKSAIVDTARQSFDALSSAVTKTKN